MQALSARSRSFYSLHKCILQQSGGQKKTPTRQCRGFWGAATASTSITFGRSSCLAGGAGTLRLPQARAVTGPTAAVPFRCHVISAEREGGEGVASAAHAGDLWQGAL